MGRRDFIEFGGPQRPGLRGTARPAEHRERESASALSDRDFPKPYTYPFRRPPVLKTYKDDETDEAGRPVKHYCVTARQSSARILERLATPVHGYNGIFPGPTISVRQGTVVKPRSTSSTTGTSCASSPRVSTTCRSCSRTRCSPPTVSSRTTTTTTPGCGAMSCWSTAGAGRTRRQRLREGANPDVNDVEQWTFENKGGGWFHPMHVHLVDVVVVGRNTNGGKPFPWAGTPSAHRKRPSARCGTPWRRPTAPTTCGRRSRPGSCSPPRPPDVGSSGSRTPSARPR